MVQEKKQSATKFVYQSIKEAIINRNISPGVQLVESVISSKLNVSRTPIRAAIKELEQEGLVNLIANRGAFVINPTMQEIIQVYEARLELEKIGFKYGKEQFSHQDIERLENLIEREEQTYQERDFLTNLEINKQFHLSLASPCKNKFLIELIEQAIHKSNVHLIFYDLFFEVHDKEDIRGLQEHKQIVQSLKERDFEKAEHLLSEHILHTLHELKENQIHTPFSNPFI
ncbi:GntR family transcriptional regulator [Halobacillus yeomjeoni]|uniref:GntR family transcriptional regulator n=1 Tax=Halobacillus yeomjeoni TaxID=311194 RepID=A0A931HXK1_9BACI|nr:GntR family transcriptional regulator [Halobacillus yeomjeoni]MBH0231527.1 GntR family transcriptional regulator [Halobacillus yeomjeoni]